jgi:AAA domain
LRVALLRGCGQCTSNRFEGSDAWRKDWFATGIVATDGVRKASRSHAFDSPMPGEYKEVRTARPDVEYEFQGQEAPIVIYSMTTSTHTDAPRGMGFLYSLNRLNVFTSRAKALSILVCSPQLFEPECRTPEQMRMANAFCRYLELAREL